MKIDMIFISITLVTCVFFPFFLFPFLAFLNTKKLKNRFKAEVKKFNFTIEQPLEWNHNIVGIDPVKKTMLFVQQREDNFFVEIVDLSVIKGTKIVPTTVVDKKNGKEEVILQQVNLEFTHKWEEEKTVLNLYDYDLNYSQELEMQNAQKLASAIEQNLTAIPHFKKTA